MCWMEGTGLGNEVGCADWDGIMRIGCGCDCGCYRKTEIKRKKKRRNGLIEAEDWHSHSPTAIGLDFSAIPLNVFICSHASQLICQSAAS